jgi:hypothetical protein
MASGFNEREVAGLLAGRPGLRSLRKPFSLAEIRVLLERL